MFWVAFTSILRGDHEERSLTLVAIATLTAQCFPARFSLRQLHQGNALWGESSKVATLVLSLNLATLPASVGVLLLPGVTKVLLVSIIDTLRRALLRFLGAHCHLLRL
jgi:hypothetical protein